jgi:FKBP-type peptidyl-prolyl cis-trans isomerase FkpA
MKPLHLSSAPGGHRIPRTGSRFALLLACVAASACVDSTGPPHPLIEETDFDPSLGIDLATMTRIGGGVYVEDLKLGDGRELGYETRVVLAYDLHLPDGRLVIRRESTDFVMGCNDVVRGLETGVSDMRVGGIRRIVVPPRMGYGERAPWPLEVPPFSILVYEVEVLSASGYPCRRG